jgi:hypothetical protein
MSEGQRVSPCFFVFCSNVVGQVFMNSSDIEDRMTNSLDRNAVLTTNSYDYQWARPLGSHLNILHFISPKGLPIRAGVNT